MTITIPSGRTLPLQAKAGGGFQSSAIPVDTPSSTWLSHSQSSRATAPLLRFTDLISGPSTGVGDGLGSGAIVTIWGQGLGDSQGTSKAYFTDFNGTKRECYVYYWKRADGELPSGPARLWYSHLMQEVAVSIPSGSVDGAGTLSIEVDALASNTLPFTVRSGNIYHVKSTGNDASDGSWSTPWLTGQHALDTAPAGSTIYFHDVDSGSMETPTERALYWNNGSALSTEAAQFTIAAYPGYQPKAIAQTAIDSFNTAGQVVSKFDVYASNYTDVDANGQPLGPVIDTVPGSTYGIKTSRNGRVVGNRIGDIIGGIASAQQGAILGNKEWVGNNKIFGNEIHEYGDNGSDKLHHTTYISIRDTSNPTVEAWEWGFNFLWDNHAKFGIHNYDEGTNVGTISGTVKIHNNVVVQQGGAGINVGNDTGWTNTFHEENNILIDVGLAADWDGLDVDTSDGPENGAFAVRDNGFFGTVKMINNTAYKWTTDGQTGAARSAIALYGAGDNVAIEFDNNAVYSEIDLPSVGWGFQGDNKTDNITGTNNNWHYTGGVATNLTVPSWSTSSQTGDPEITLDGAIVTVSSTSPLKAASNATTTETHDIYGVPRPATATIGAVEASS